MRNLDTDPADNIKAPLLLCHPLWVAFAEHITDGAEFPLVNIREGICNVGQRFGRRCAGKI
jgi:hypothetical protein